MQNNFKVQSRKESNTFKLDNRQLLKTPRTKQNNK